MKRILISLLIIVAATGMAAGTTSSYFSSKAKITPNTFSTGTLDIRINGQTSKVGATFSAVAPGVLFSSPDYQINNYGQPWFNGSSNLSAKKLMLSVEGANGDFNMWHLLKIKVEVNRGWPTWQVAYEGNVDSLVNADLLSPRWTELVPGSSETLRYTIWLPDVGDQTSYMGKTINWSFVVEGRTS